MKTKCVPNKDVRKKLGENLPKQSSITAGEERMRKKLVNQFIGEGTVGFKQE